MNTINDNLKDVIERNIDASNGYQNAADNVQNSALSNAFREQATQRRSFANELQSAAGISSISGEVTGTMEASAHRTWMDLKTALSSDKTEAVLEECIRGEKEALDESNELINQESLTGNVSQLIISQRDTVRDSIRDLQTLEERVD